MESRIIDLSDEPASLNVRYEQLIIKRGDKENSVPLEEIAALIVAHPAVCFTQAVLNGIIAHGGIFIICNERRLPAGMLLPLESHSTQTERISAQINASAPLQKQLWSQLVNAKLKAQSGLLSEISGNDWGIASLARKLRSGDPSNIEAQASRRYWQALFGETFRRIPGAEDNVNSLLNYGYAILRGIIARAICGSGLHPSIGIHHHNRYNPFCLADDLMEPFRPLVDASVFAILGERGPDAPLDKIGKAFLIEKIAFRRFELNGEERTLFEIAARLAASLASVYLGKGRKLQIPAI